MEKIAEKKSEPSRQPWNHFERFQSVAEQRGGEITYMGTPDGRSGFFVAVPAEGNWREVYDIDDSLVARRGLLRALIASARRARRK